MIDVTAVGELLIDFTPAGKSTRGHALYEQNPGGAPANVLAFLSRLGHKTAFIGKVGCDLFGESLASILREAGVDCRALLKTDVCHTTLAFVHLDEQGDRSFTFYRNPGADLLLEPDDLPDDLIDQARFFHFGSVTMTDEPARSATKAAVRMARRYGCLVSYDPNLRLMLWHSETEARNQILSVMDQVDLLKISDDELLFLTGKTDLNQGANWFFERFPLSVVLITEGPRGAFAATRRVSSHHPAFDVKTVDTTGAGDAFTGAFIDRLLSRKSDSMEDLSQEELIQYLAFANAAGSLTTTQKGAIPAMPDREEIERCMNELPTLKITEHL